MQSTQDAHDKILCCLFEARLHNGDTPRRRTVPVSTDRDKRGAPCWVNYVQNPGAEIELGLSSLADKYKNKKGREHLPTLRGGS